MLAFFSSLVAVVAVQLVIVAVVAVGECYVFILNKKKATPAGVMGRFR